MTNTKAMIVSGLKEELLEIFGIGRFEAQYMDEDEGGEYFDRLTTFFANDAKEKIAVLKGIMEEDRYQSEISDAIGVVGEFEEDSDFRFEFLSSCLQSKVSLFRYGALNGLSHIKTSECKAVLEDYLRQENALMLQKITRQLLSYLPVSVT